MRHEMDCTWCAGGRRRETSSAQGGDADKTHFQCTADRTYGPPAVRVAGGSAGRARRCWQSESGCSASFKGCRRRQGTLRPLPVFGSAEGGAVVALSDNDVAYGFATRNVPPYEPVPVR